MLIHIARIEPNFHYPAIDSICCALGTDFSSASYQAKMALYKFYLHKKMMVKENE